MLLSRSLLVVLAHFLLLNLTLAAADPNLEPFQGAWKVVELTDSGVKIPQDEFPEVLHSGGEFRIHEDQIIFHSVLDHRQYSKTIQVDNKHNPPHFNILLHDETTGWGIYKFDGNRLTVCLSADAARDRPDAFISNEESSHALMVLERDPTNTKSEPKKDSRPPKTNTNSATTGEPKEQGEAKPIQQQELIPTDLKIALALVGTWRVPQESIPFYIWLKQDGTFVTSRDVPRIRTFSMLFFNLPVSSGHWTVSNGVLRLQISNSVNSQRVGARLEFAVQNLTPQGVSLVSHLGSSIRAVRFR